MRAPPHTREAPRTEGLRGEVPVRSRWGTGAAFGARDRAPGGGERSGLRGGPLYRSAPCRRSGPENRRQRTERTRPRECAWLRPLLRLWLACAASSLRPSPLGTDASYSSSGRQKTTSMHPHKATVTRVTSEPRESDEDSFSLRFGRSRLKQPQKGDTSISEHGRHRLRGPRPVRLVSGGDAEGPRRIHGAFA